MAAQSDCTKAAIKVIATTSEKLQHSMARTRKTKFGDIVLSMPGMRSLNVEETAAKPSSTKNWTRLAEDHDLAARARTAAPVQITSAM